MFLLQVTKATNDCRDFLRFVTKGYIVLAAMKVLDINTISDFKAICDEKTSLEQKKDFLDQVASCIVSNYVTTKEFSLDQGGQASSTVESNLVPCGRTDTREPIIIN